MARIEAAAPTLAIACSPTERFTDLVRSGADRALFEWLKEAETSPMAAFARGLRADEAAVPAGLREPWSNGQTEGQIKRLKILNRQMYGGTNIDLLKTRMLTTARAHHTL